MHYLFSVSASQWFLLAFVLQVIAAVLGWQAPKRLNMAKRRGPITVAIVIFALSIVSSFAFTVGIVRWGQQMQDQHDTYERNHRYGEKTSTHRS